MGSPSIGEQRRIFQNAKREAHITKKKEAALDQRYEDDLRGHTELLRVVLEAHREGMNESEMLRGLDDYDHEELYLDEKQVYEGIEQLCSKRPPAAVQGRSGWVYHSMSLGLFRPEHPLRFLCIWIVESPIFDPIVLLTIVANCVTMAMASPLDQPGSWKQALIAKLEPVFLYVFTFEMLTKMLAYGVFGHRHSYLRDPWCQLDFVVVSFAWLPILLPSFGNFPAIRAIRAVRPLRALKRVPGMPVLIGSIVKAFPKLADVAILSAFIFLIFGIVGMNLFNGIMHQRCADPAVLSLPAHGGGHRALLGDDHAQLAAAVRMMPPDGRGLGAANATEAFALAGAASAASQVRGLLSSAVGAAAAGAVGAAASSSAAAAGGAADAARRSLLMSAHPEAQYDRGTLCHADADVCDADGSVCFHFTENPEQDTVSFDDVAMAMLIIFQAITFDTWADPMFDVIEAYGEGGRVFVTVFFVAICILGGLFVVNLFLAVIFQEFMTAQQAEDTEREQKEHAKRAEQVRESLARANAIHAGEVDTLMAADIMRSDGEVGAPETQEPGCCVACCLVCCDCAPEDGGWRQTLENIMTGSVVSNLSTTLVVFNILVMCMPYAGQPLAWEILSEGLSEWITWMFIVEMALKMIAMGCWKYWADGWNALDGVIVTLSIVEMLITILLADTGINISFLRMLRLLRLLRLLKAWPGLFRIVMAFVKSIPQISNLFVLMVLIMFIFALLGMQTFGGTDISIESRWHFDYFFPAIITVFNVFTGNWVDPFQSCTFEKGLKTASLFFIPTLIIGFFIIMNLFIAILLEAFGNVDKDNGSELDDAEYIEDEPPTDAQGNPMHKAAFAKMGKRSITVTVPAEDATDPDDFSVLEDKEPLLGMSLNFFPPKSYLRRACRDVAENGLFDSFIILVILASSVCLVLDVPRLDPTSELKANLTLVNYWFTGIFIGEMLLKIVAYGLLFTPKAYLKQPWNILDFCIVFVSILGLLASIVPAFDKLKSLRILRVLRPLRLLQRIASMKIIILSLIRTLPSVIEVTAVVLVFHVIFAILGMQLFSDTWGSCTHSEFTTRDECHVHLGKALDSFSSPRLLATAGDDGALASHGGASWRAADSLPLAGLPASALNASVILPAVPLLVQHAIATTLPSLARAQRELSDWWHGEGADEANADAESPLSEQAVDVERRRRIWRGQQLEQHRREMWPKRAGARRRLAGSARSGRALKGGYADDEVESDVVEWINPPIGSFDNFGEAMVCLYVVSSGDAWEEYMWMGMDAKGVGIAPERNDYSGAAVFFLMWMIVGSFLSINLFVGAIVDNFNRIKKESDGSALMTPEQQQWADAIKAMANNSAQKAPKPPRGGPRLAAFNLVQSNGFNMLVMTVIGFNVLGMALDYYQMEQDPLIHWLYTRGMMFFTYFYYAECLLKLFALCCDYFADPWCQFDFFLVCVSLADQFFVEYLMTILPIPPTVLRVLRVARVLRILRLLKNLKGLRDLVFTLILAFPSMLNIAALLSLAMFIYAVLGMNLFTFVRHGDAIDDDKNFETFSSACFVLFQSLTGDGWSEFMDDLRVDESRGCDPAPEDGSPSDCGSALALPYFITWTVVGTYVFLNLVIAVILEHFTALGKVDPGLVSTHDIADFKEEWANFDPDADGLIPAKDMPDLVRAIRPPIGLGQKVTHGFAVRFCISLGVSATNGQVEFKDVLDALLNQNYAKKGIDVNLDNASSPPAVREALEQRRKSVKNLVSFSDLKNAADGKKVSGSELTPRRFEVAKVFADQLMEGWVRRKREYWNKYPESHPRVKGMQRRASLRHASKLGGGGGGLWGSKAGKAMSDAHAPNYGEDGSFHQKKIAAMEEQAAAEAPTSVLPSTGPSPPASAKGSVASTPKGGGAGKKSGSVTIQERRGSNAASSARRGSTGGQPAGSRKDLPKPTSLPAPRRQDMSRVDA